ncbi:MAG: aa3-type cytochrome c oxidase subunit IV, partial [Alphaproteobacteria bacterium]
ERTFRGFIRFLINALALIAVVLIFLAIFAT